MRIGILGAGLMGGKLGTIFARAGHDVVFSYSRDPEKLQTLAKDAGRHATAGTPAAAAAGADAVILAVHWTRVDDVLAQAGRLAGKTVVTCTLPMSKDDSRLVLGFSTSGAEALAPRCRRRAWCRPSARRRVKCCSRCSRNASAERDQPSCCAGTTPAQRRPRPR
jgi:hypothetical protein